MHERFYFMFVDENSIVDNMACLDVSSCLLSITFALIKDIRVYFCGMIHDTLVYTHALNFISCNFSLKKSF